MINAPTASWETTSTSFGGLVPYVGTSRPRYERVSGNAAAGQFATVEFADSDIEADQPDIVLMAMDQLQARTPQFQPVGSALLKDIEPRLRELQAQFIDDYDSQLQQSSIFALKVILASAPGIRRPTLSAEPSGHLIATWRNGTASLSLRLLSGAELHFAFGGTARTESADGEPRFGSSLPATFFARSHEALLIAR